MRFSSRLFDSRFIKIFSPKYAVKIHVPQVTKVQLLNTVNTSAFSSIISAAKAIISTASRLEALTKQLQVELVISQSTLQTAKIDEKGLAMESYEIRGREDTISGISLKSASQLSDYLSQAR